MRNPIASIGCFNILIAATGVIFVLVSLYYFWSPRTEIVVSIPVHNETLVPIERDLCCAVCIKDKKSRLMEIRDVALLESVPIPQCVRSRPEIDKRAYEEWNSRGHCVTTCLKGETGHLTAVNETCGLLPFCRSIAQPDLDFDVYDKPIAVSERLQIWERTENLAGGCNKVHGLNRTLYRSADDIGIHIVYFAWMKSNKNARHIVPEQLYDVERSGLFDRPNTFLHIVVSTDSDAEFDWLKELPVVKNNAKTLTRAKKNRYEFPGIRMLWELGCKALSERRNDDLFIYFHSKGSRFNKGRLGLELAMTYEVVANWKLILNLIVANPSSLTFGLGGHGFQWITFFWARADLFNSAPMPVITHSRYWYEFWTGFNLKHDFPSAANTSQCHLATGTESVSIIADSDFVPKNAKEIPNDKATRTISNFHPEHLTNGGRLPQYALTRCGMIRVTDYAIQNWWGSAGKRYTMYLSDKEKFLAPVVNPSTNT